MTPSGDFISAFALLGQRFLRSHANSIVRVAFNNVRCIRSAFPFEAEEGFKFLREVLPPAIRSKRLNFQSERGLKLGKELHGPHCLL
ncbi:hypothetical protein Ae201684_009137 [Aphanomyces euteiches]|uniref:Uncharacterized protein n=1 Tax=Aphanomyces euteiches TaxID=100861 RepID=A0A6G0X2C2_9STRA|nr:hypothetical protein Ae201684_009137 [Aphanomyces euteiches]